MSEFPITQVLDRLTSALADKPQPLIDQMQNAGAFKVLIATLLSLRTRDETTAQVTPRLFARASTPAAMRTLSEGEIAQLIYPVGFYRNKARDILRICTILCDTYAGAVPRTRTELLALPGVGLKTANLVLAVGHGIPAICVDVHVHRICNRWGYLDTPTPDTTEAALTARLPVAYWMHINELLVTLGQQICTPTSPRCTQCPVADVCARRGVTRHR